MPTMETEVEIKKILIVDDHPVCRKGVRYLLENESDLAVCGEAETTDEALQQIEITNPDLVLIDLSLRDSNGIDLIKLAKSRYGHQLKMIVLSMHEETLLVERVIRAGARGYVTKKEAAQHLTAAIRNVLEGKFYLSEATKEKALQSEFSSTSQESSMQSLSDRELEIFQLIGEGMTTALIAKSLHLSIKTVEGYRANIRSKLSLKDNMELIRCAVRWTQAGQAA